MADVVKGTLDRTSSSISNVSLADKYDLAKRRVYLSGPQAVARLLLMQKALDRRAGLNTAGFISGYPGSPLGGLDHNFIRARDVFEANDILFQPGLNEDLAATAVWGSQQAEMRGEGRFDGVFGLWYGKGPGVDRSGDVFRHVNLAGSSKHGGVLALIGDDHTAESSTTAHQSEFNFIDAMMPILSPAGVQEIIDYGLLGFAMSRFAGVWVGLKCLKDTVESTASIDAALDRAQPLTPADFTMPPGGLNIRARDSVLDQEKRLHSYKMDAVQAWLRANRLNRIITSGGPNAKIGVIAAGKSYLDVRQAMDELDLDEADASALGLRILKLGCVWPLEPLGVREFAQGLDLIIVVEEKRSLIESQLRELLYGSPSQPTVIGKKDENGGWLFPASGALDANAIAIAIGRRLARGNPSVKLEQRLKALDEAQAMLGGEAFAARSPHFCSGCPHNSSTKVPDGMRAFAGIGCHYMVLSMDRATEGVTQMGGEGANWVGEAPFSKRPHVFQNLGDGTYNHSGILAIRFAVTAGANITYKILFNDAIAMTGGQRLEGGLSVDRVARQVAAENVARVVVVTDETAKYPANLQWPAGLTVHDRHELDAVQRELAATPGVTVLIYDQTCANEKRRRRKRGEYPDPVKRVFINERVCEGCGDCGAQSNCVSIQPLETEFGRKRVIDQSNCNKDFSCTDGFCPSFVTVHGARPKKPPAQNDFDASAPASPGNSEDRAAALCHPGHRRRRHGRRHRRRHSRHGGPYRGQGLRLDGHGGARPEGRRGAEPRQDRGRARRHPRHQGRRRRGRPHSRLRSRRRRIGRGPRRDPQGRHRRPRQHRRDLSGRIHARSRLHIARRGDQAGSPPGCWRRRALRRRDRHSDGAARQFDCRQYVHARPRLAAGPDPSRRRLADARHRTQWRSRRNEP